MLKALSKSFDIYLGCFVDDPFDWQYADKLDKFCKQKLLIKQHKTLAKIKGLKAFFSGEAISVPYYYSSEMAKWSNHILASENIKQVFVYSSPMAQYVEGDNYANFNRVIDFVDVDSDKWHQYAQGKTGVARWVYQREHRKLQGFENRIAEQFQHSLFVSPQEANLFKQQIPQSLAVKVSGMLNGVDTAFFDPKNSEIQALEEKVDVVFTGAMDYWANVDAVIWFSQKVWPLIRAKYPDACFYVVGGNPSAQILDLHGKHGVNVTGRVVDVRPYILQAKVAIAPLQIARGLQNKVLEAMSMAKPIVATSMAIEGIEGRNEDVHICDDPVAFAGQVCHYLVEFKTVQCSRDWILENLQWNETLAKLPMMFEEK